MKPYVLLRDALQKADRMALVTVAVRSRMTLAVLRVRDGVIVLQTLLGRTGACAGVRVALRRHPCDEQGARHGLVARRPLSGDYEPDEFEDDYSEAVERLVASKIEAAT